MGFRRKEKLWALFIGRKLSVLGLFGSFVIKRAFWFNFYCDSLLYHPIWASKIYKKGNQVCLPLVVAWILWNYWGSQHWAELSVLAQDQVLSHRSCHPRRTDPQRMARSLLDTADKWNSKIGTIRFHEVKKTDKDSLVISKKVRYLYVKLKCFTPAFSPVAVVPAPPWWTFISTTQEAASIRR